MAPARDARGRFASIDEQTGEIKRQMWDRVAARQVSLALNLHERLVVATPVDTGNARANWAITVGQPISAPISERPTRPGETVSTAAQDALFSAVASYRPADRRGLKVLFVANLAPYIELLRQGRSRQAPAGWVERAIEGAIAEENALAGDDHGIRAELGFAWPPITFGGG